MEYPLLGFFLKFYQEQSLSNTVRKYLKSENPKSV